MMEFRIADTFTDSLSRLTSDEQKITKTTAFDLQVNPTGTGHGFHKLEKSRDKNFWSVKVNSGIRLIVHKTQNSILLCYVDHHDKAYDWAERRKLEVHPKTGAAQVVEVRETITEILVPVYKPTEVETARKPLLFANTTDEELLSYGVPVEWLSDVKKADEDSLLLLADRLPAEAAEALLELATGGKPRINVPTVPLTNPFDHPDAQRRFRVMGNIDELKTALEYPWEKWTVFLHPEQREWINRSYGGPARVSGSAGTGKTIVALHRAVTLAKAHPEARVLLTTYSDTLARALQTKLRRLIGNEPKLGDRIDVYSINSLGIRLAKMYGIQSNIASEADIKDCIQDASNEITSHKYTQHFLCSEWEQIVDAWQLTTWESYRDVTRLGRKTRLPETQRTALWSIFEIVRSQLVKKKLTTFARLFTELAVSIGANKKLPFDFAVIDEAQDISISHLRFLASLGTGRPDSLFFAGDLGQRIFQQPFSWKALGVDIRGRSRTLRINYRTSHQIRQQADKLLGPITSDIDGNAEDRTDTISVFNGPEPLIRTYESDIAEINAVAKWIADHSSNGLLPQEFGVFVRSDAQIERAKSAVMQAGLKFKVLDDHVETASGYVSISTMHLAKGLEFRAVIVMACDDEVLPLQGRIQAIGDDADLQEVYDTERHLLYVACTRARDFLFVSGVDPSSEFLDDMSKKVSIRS
jgi:superfamily I DNA/RNA helicase/mRNA-degrading endonuclease RelE of RelBE toxin-antitoxin system